MATPIPRNGASFTLGEIARATGGTVRDADAGAIVRGVCTDSRAVEPGALFVAITGETHDGHAHVATARARGAAATLVQRGRPSDGARVEVDDTLVALGALARCHADRVRAVGHVPSVAITGSAGKTTTKELTAACARALFGETLATAGNLNNLVGVPMTLFTLTDAHRAMVIECGTSARGEIARLGAIVGPDVSVVLNADAGHTEGIGSIEDVAVEKGALFVAASRRAIGNADDAPSRARLSTARVPTLLFGESADAHVRLVRRSPARGGRASIEIAIAPSLLAPGTEPVVRAELGLLGGAAALDAAAAIAACIALSDAPLDARALATLAHALGSVAATPGRLAPRSLADAVIVDDSYNANPRSVRASLQAAGELARGGDGRLLVVLGDMLELGALSEQLHAEVGDAVARAGVSVFVTVGERMAVAARVAAASAGPLVVETTRAEDAAVVVSSVLRPRDVVLVKGSRGMATERVVEALLASETARAAATAEVRP